MPRPPHPRSARRLVTLLLIWSALLSLALWAIPVSAEGAILYVRQGASGANDGSSWEDAFSNLQDALAALAGTAHLNAEVWIAAGTYKPGTSREATFRLLDGVALYGGFRGDEIAREQRDTLANPTILSGDLNGDDNDNIAYQEPSREDNCYHVVTAQYTGMGTILDGLTITGGHDNRNLSDSLGGGLRLLSGTLQLANCTLRRNVAYAGGALYALDAVLTVAHCTFDENLAKAHGGGIAGVRGRLRIGDTLFEDNTALIQGGGLFAREGDVRVEGSTFTGNSARYGGGMHTLDSAPLVSACTFQRNHARQGGGVGVLGGTANIADSRFEENTADEKGGALSAYLGNATLQDSTLWRNGADSGGGIWLYRSSATLSRCLLEENDAFWQGGGLFSEQDSQPIVRDCTFRGNVVANRGGGGMLSVASPTSVVSTTFAMNVANYGGGGLELQDSLATVANCLFHGNRVYSGGGGLYQATSEATVVNSALVANVASSQGGGGLAHTKSTLRLVNCTLTANRADEAGALRSVTDSRATIINAILWEDQATSGQEIYHDVTGSLTVTHSLVSGSFAGEGNLEGEPGFYRAPTFGPDGLWSTPDDDYGDMRLRADSPARDRGALDALPADSADLDGDGDLAEAIPYDLAGLPRVSWWGVDLGAYEYQVVLSARGWIPLVYKKR